MAEFYYKEDVILKILYSGLFDDCRIESVRDCLESIPTVEAYTKDKIIPREEVEDFILSITNMKHAYEEGRVSIDYGTICDLWIRGIRLLEKYKENEDRNDKQ